MLGSIVRKNGTRMVLRAIVTHQQTDIHTLLGKNAIDLLLQEALPIVSGHED